MSDAADPLDVSGGVPYETLEHLRQVCPVSRTVSGAYFLARYDDVLAAAKDVDLFRASFREPGVVVLPEEQLISEIPEPRHGRIRRIINSAIAQHRVGRIEPFARQLCHRLLDDLLRRRHVELVHDFITPIPLISGNETTRHLIANLLSTVCADRSLFERLAGDPDLIPAAVEESLRFDPPIHVLMRNCTADTTIDGVNVPAGSKVAFGVASANRDRHYVDADTFRLDRPNGREHLSFGSGPHVCPGASLARLEGRIALEVFCERVASARIDQDYMREQVPVFWANGPRSIPVTIEPRARAR